MRRSTTSTINAETPAPSAANCAVPEMAGFFWSLCRQDAASPSSTRSTAIGSSPSTSTPKAQSSCRAEDHGDAGALFGRRARHSFGDPDRRRSQTLAAGGRSAVSRPPHRKCRPPGSERYYSPLRLPGAGHGRTLRRPYPLWQFGPPGGRAGTGGHRRSSSLCERAAGPGVLPVQRQFILRHGLARPGGIRFGRRHHRHLGFAPYGARPPLRYGRHGG